MVKSYTEVWEVLNPCLQGGMGLMSEFNDKACKQLAFAAHHLTSAFNIVKWYAQYTINPQFNYTLCITYVNLCSFLTPTTLDSTFQILDDCSPELINMGLF